MGKKVAIIQSNYIPWKGYFDIINAVDEFILYDEAQYTKRDWRNRNKIKTPQGPQWLSIPVKVKGRFFQLIHETEISETTWAEQHLKAIRHNYARADCFKSWSDRLDALFTQAAEEPFLSKVNYLFTKTICEWLGITTKITWSMDYQTEQGKNERLISLCLQAGADTYLSGPSARSYMDHALFAESNLTIHYVNYAGYPEYPQVHPPFEHGVTVLDLLLSVGDDAPRFMKTFGYNDSIPFIEVTE